MSDDFRVKDEDLELEEASEGGKLERCRVLRKGLKFNDEEVEFDDKFISATGINDVHTTWEMVQQLESNKNVDIDARILVKTNDGLGHVRMNKEEFLEQFNRTKNRFQRGLRKEMREGLDLFVLDDSVPQIVGPIIGSPDYIPYLQGPFYKQLYYYDYIRMHAGAFYAYHHDPLARRIIDIIRDFTLGRGWRVDSDNQKALAVWRAFEEVNSLVDMMSYFIREISLYGESMIWWLPDGATKITYQLSPDQKIPKGIIPRIRLIDPSVIWEIVTYPEDITRVLFYQWVAPTQYQIYSAGSVPGSKFIYQQLPANQVDHWKINCVSNEKRGRSELFPVLGYLKLLRDSVKYSVAGMQKAAAWSMDTTIQGAQSDLDAYVTDQQNLGAIPPAGSEFVHTNKITRQYIGNAATMGGGHNPAFEWCLNMIAAGVGMPVDYFGVHMPGGGTRASALVKTEPVAKKFEQRQKLLEDALKKIAKRLFADPRFEGLDIKDAEIEVTFPEIIVQDRSAKLKDLSLAKAEGWISQKRAATIAAKELDVTEYDYDQEKIDIGSEQIPETPIPGPGLLTAPGKVQPSQSQDMDSKVKPSAVTSDDKRKLDLSYGA